MILDSEKFNDICPKRWVQRSKHNNSVYFKFNFTSIVRIFPQNETLAIGYKTFKGILPQKISNIK